MTSSLRNTDICYDISGGTQYRHEVHETPEGEIVLSAYWNDAQKWGELAVYTPYGNHAYRWDATGGRFDTLLTAAADYLLSKLLGSYLKGRELDLESAFRMLVQALPQALSEMADRADCISDLAGCETEAAIWCWAQRWQVPNVEECLVWRHGEDRAWFTKHVMPLVHALGMELRSVWYWTHRGPLKQSY